MLRLIALHASRRRDEVVARTAQQRSRVESPHRLVTSARQFRAILDRLQKELPCVSNAKILFAITPLHSPLDAVGMTACGTQPLPTCPDPAPDARFVQRGREGNSYPMRFETRRQAMDEVIDWLAYYNHRRLHSTLGYMSPMQFKNNRFAAQLNKAA